MLSYFKYFVAGLTFWFSIHTACIVADGLLDEEGKGDVGIIFGNTVNPDGTLSERLKKRLDTGAALYHTGTIGSIVVSGGLGKEGFYEGTKMYEYLIQQGIPEEKIIVDNLGTTTQATANNCKRLGFNHLSAVVITQYFHVSRAKLALRNAGFEKVTGVHAPYFELRDVYAIVREFPAYYKYLLH